MRNVEAWIKEYEDLEKEKLSCETDIHNLRIKLERIVEKMENVQYQIKNYEVYHKEEKEKEEYRKLWAVCANIQGDNKRIINNNSDICGIIYPKMNICNIIKNEQTVEINKEHIFALCNEYKIKRICIESFFENNGFDYITEMTVIK